MKYRMNRLKRVESPCSGLVGPGFSFSDRPSALGNVAGWLGRLDEPPLAVVGVHSVVVVVLEGGVGCSVVGCRRLVGRVVVAVAYPCPLPS